MIPPEMTIMDAVVIVRGQAAKETGEVRSALTMLADLAEYHHKRQYRRKARRRNGRTGQMEQTGLEGGQ